ncbi:unnamed protein product [Acidithrix sp. C25]|nr:unnamed protein product [Acidithrix sp. C25]
MCAFHDGLFEQKLNYLITSGWFELHLVIRLEIHRHRFPNKIGRFERYPCDSR